MWPIHATTRAQHHVITPVRVTPHLGVAHVAGQILGIILGRQHHALLAELPTGKAIKVTEVINDYTLLVEELTPTII